MAADVSDSLEDMIQPFNETRLPDDEIDHEVPSSISFDELALKLISENFILTALELHTELVESGQELPRLRDYFSNPGNFERQALTKPEVSPGLQMVDRILSLFNLIKPRTNGLWVPIEQTRTSSVQTFDSLDFARYSDDGERQIDERVAVLEFELRKAKETIKFLRAHLTVATESESNTPDSSADRPVVDELIKPYEQRALNFLVNEYLLKYNYKLTSITFADENEDQDFEDWDDVGLNISKPPDLLHLYRNFCHHVYSEMEFNSVAVQVSLNSEKEKEWETIREELETEIRNLKERINILHGQNEMLSSSFKNIDDGSHIFNASSTSDTLDTSQDSPRNHSSLFRLQESLPSHLIEDAQYRGQGDAADNKHIIPLKESSGETDLETKFKVLKSGANLHSLNSKESTSDVAVMTPARKITSEKFHQHLLDSCFVHKIPQDSRLTTEVKEIIDSSDKVILMLGRCLPHIVPNVILAKREELIPVLLCTIHLHPNPKERDKLLNILFNLIKKPDDDQRQMILTGFQTIAKYIGATRVEAELLPQCWEQPEIRSSLLLSMLQQMLVDDKSVVVREAVVRSLALLILYIDDEDKFIQGYELLTIAVADSSDKVVATALQVLLPAFAAWALELDKLETYLLEALLKTLEDRIKGLSPTNLSPANNISSAEEAHVIIIINMLHSLLSWLFLSVLRSGPFIVKLDQDIVPFSPELDVNRLPQVYSTLEFLHIIVGNRDEVMALIKAYDDYTDEEWFESWSKFDWLLKMFVPRLLTVTEEIYIGYNSSLQVLSNFFHDLCLVFGTSFLNNKIKPMFRQITGQLGPQIHDVSILTKGLVTVYATGILSIFHNMIYRVFRNSVQIYMEDREHKDNSSSMNDEDRKELTIFLQDLLHEISISEAPLGCISAIIKHLSTDPSMHDLLLTVLWNGVVHASPLIKSNSARLFELLIGNVNDALLSSRIIPALVTLANDSEISVRISTIPAFGAIMQMTTQKDLLDKVHLQFQTFLDEAQYQEQTSLHIQLIQTFGVVGPNCESKFREEFILPRLANMALNNNHLTDESRRLEVALALIDAYTSLSCCFLSDKLITQSLLPGLRCLLQDVHQLAPHLEKSVTAMIDEFEAKVEIVRPTERSGSFVGSMAMSPASMEDMKNRMSKIFTGAKNQGRPNIPNIFHLRKK